MSIAARESLLVALYTDHEMREQFLADPDSMLSDFDLSAQDQEELRRIDTAGLVLAANSFTYKRWRANRGRFTQCRQVAVYTGLWDPVHLAGARTLHDALLSDGAFARCDRSWTQPGFLYDLLPVGPANQIDHRHVLASSDHYPLLSGIWERLMRLHLRHHHLVRAYMHRWHSAQDTHAPVRLHDHPGAFTTYVVLGSNPPPVQLEVTMGTAQSPVVLALQAGSAVTVPSDLPQRFAACEGDAASHAVLETLCFKTLSTAL